MSDMEEWVDVCSPESGDYLERIRVPGGWLYRTVIRSDLLRSGESALGMAIAMCFVPDAPTEHRSL